MVRAAGILFLVLLFASSAQAEKRVALVIGNSAYQHTPQLDNPKNDAADIAGVLKKHGFEVTEGIDLDKAAFDRKIRDFAATLAASEVGVFFYAGHGLQVAGQNYLVPIDAQLTTASALEFEMVRLDLVHRVMEREARTNISSLTPAVTIPSRAIWNAPWAHARLRSGAASPRLRPEREL